MANVRPKPRGDRRGVAAVEFAFVLPIIFLLTAGTIEMCSTIFLRESVILAAHEGARAATKRQATEQDVLAAVNDILAIRGVNVAALGGNHVSVSPNPSGAAILTPITVNVQAPTSGNTLLPIPSWFTWVGGRTVAASVSMVREYND